MNVLDSLHEDGPKLVEMTPEAELALRAQISGLKIIPVVEYHKMRAELSILRELDENATVEQPARELVVKVVDKVTGIGLPGAKVVAFTNFRRREGDQAVTSADGTVQLRIKRDVKLDRLYIYGPPKYWGYYASAIIVEGNLALSQIDPADQDYLLRWLYGSVPDNAGNGVRIGVVDSGVAKNHPALTNVTGGANLVYDEISGDPGATDDWGPAETDGDHGTHVAGIIGARPTAAMPIRGVAPGVEIRSYRVFPNHGGGATNYDIMNAIDRAVLDGCHLVNLSLGGGGEDEGVRAAIGAAMDAGVVVVAAAGNDGRRAVSFPAALPSSVAVSAMGRRGCFPNESTETADVARPFGNPDRDVFVAAFSNIGPQVDLTGPGVGIVSTLPPDSFGVMSGTSMACPAITGWIAFLLASDATISTVAKNEQAQRLKNVLYNSARQLGFGRDYEGFGLPRDWSVAAAQVGV
jgi:subtilisin